MNVRLAHFYALRAHIEALILAEETEQGIPAEQQPGRCPVCGAGPDMVENASMLAGPRRCRCTKCGAEWDG